MARNHLERFAEKHSGRNVTVNIFDQSQNVIQQSGAGAILQSMVAAKMFQNLSESRLSEISDNHSQMVIDGPSEVKKEDSKRVFNDVTDIEVEYVEGNVIEPKEKHIYSMKPSDSISQAALTIRQENDEDVYVPIDYKGSLYIFINSCKISKVFKDKNINKIKMDINSSYITSKDIPIEEYISEYISIFIIETPIPHEDITGQIPLYNPSYHMNIFKEEPTYGSHPGNIFMLKTYHGDDNLIITKID